MSFDPWIAVAIVASLTGYAIYLASLRRRLVEPNRASWLIWGCATTVEAVTYAAVNPGTGQTLVFLVSAAASLGIAAVLWRQSRWRSPDPLETVCVAASLTALVLWIALRQTFWAHMLVVAAVPVSFWPTWRSAWADPARERSPAWGLWTIGDLATLLVATRSGSQDLGEYAYVLTEFACHAAVWFMVGLASINPWRAFGWRAGRLRILDSYSPGNPFTIGESHVGKAVFAADGFRAGETILAFAGPRLSANRLPRRRSGPADRHVQIGPDLYLGPSGAADDLVNHSCAPNAGVRFLGTAIHLIAIRDIAPGEEITWDYSTTLADPDWTMPCACGAEACRGTIAAFATLPAERREWYIARNLVAPYLRPAVPTSRPAARAV